MTVGSKTLENLNPKLYDKCQERTITQQEQDEDVADEFDAREIFDLIRNITDPEHPLTLEQLNVVQLENIQVDNSANEINVEFKPTIDHCSMATLIGLSIRIQLMRSLPSRFKVGVRILPGSHASEAAINKQLADKERVAAATENSNIVKTVNQCLAQTIE
ncbi:hypothetical protein AAG570_004371 [Ranatra chinensis]|uniref:MIP18 family-like domain-containing protein n=1 Tax=Ranatra chinensis TaxID=642074 RepID=A0ABD0YFE1_9HEMI